MATVILYDPNLATSNAFPPAKERPKAFQSCMFSRVVQAGYNRDGQFSGTNAIGIEVERLFYGPH